MKNKEQNKQTREGITRPKEILEEVTKLRMFETTRQIVKFLKEEYGLSSTVEATRPDEFIDIYLTDFKHDENIEIDLPEDKISKAILKTFNEIHKDEKLKAINVWPTEFGYTIVLDKGENDETLKENYLYYYYYGEVSNEYNRYDKSDENRNFSMRKPLQEAKEEEEALLNKLTKKEDETEDEYKQSNEVNNNNQDKPERRREEPVNTDEVEIGEPEEVKDKENIEQGIANKILDNRFIWFFVVMDEYTEELTEELDDLEEAIDYLIELEEASMLVAFPYTDPNPEDDEVELVFADNPGPIILYDKED